MNADDHFPGCTNNGTYICPHYTSVIGEEITFEDVNISSADGSKDTGPNNKLGLLSSFNRSDKSYYSQAPDSPCGSIGSSSNVSRGSDTARSTKSLMSLRSQKERPMP
jgi:hypothetical protein